MKANDFREAVFNRLPAVGTPYLVVYKKPAGEVASPYMGGYCFFLRCHRPEAKSPLMDVYRFI